MGKYADHCVTMFLKQHGSPEPGRSSVFMFGQDHFEQAGHWVEMWMVTGNNMLMQGTPKAAEQIIHIGPDGHRGGPYPKYHRNADNLMFFYGTDPNDFNDLGAHVEFHLGEGEDEEVFEFDEPRCVFVPKGVRHGPMYVTNFRRNLIVFDVLTAPTRQAAGTENDFSYAADEEKLKLVGG
jgi:hypothetical protein